MRENPKSVTNRKRSCQHVMIAVLMMLTRIRSRKYAMMGETACEFKVQSTRAVKSSGCVGSGDHLLVLPWWMSCYERPSTAEKTIPSQCTPRRASLHRRAGKPEAVDYPKKQKLSAHETPPRPSRTSPASL